VGKGQCILTRIIGNTCDSFVVINTTAEAWLSSQCLKRIPMIMWSFILLLSLMNKG